MPSLAAVTLVYAAAALIAFIGAAVLWTRRDSPGGRPLALLMLAATWWAIGDAIELHMSTVAAKQLVSQLQYVGIVSAAPFFFHAAMALAGRRLRRSPGLLLAVWGIPLASLAMAWTNPWHHWLWTDIHLPQDGSLFATYEYGWWFWVLTAQHYALMVAASVVLIAAIRRVGHGFGVPMALVVLAVALPWIGNAAYNAKLGPWPGLNWLTLSLGISGWLMTWVVVREGLLDLLPQVRGVLMEMMRDGVVILGRGGEVLYANGAARDTLHLDATRLASAIEVASLQEIPREWRAESLITSDGVRRWLDVSVDPVFDRWGELAGRIVVARDVTRQKSLEQEQERLIAELQGALGKIMKLEGMLPICAHCHNVRDDRGYWSRIEDYISTRTPLEFTHAICPDCIGRLYPDGPRPPARN